MGFFDDDNSDPNDPLGIKTKPKTDPLGILKKKSIQEQFGIPLPVFKNGGTNGSSVVSSGGSDLIPTGKAEEQPQQAEQPYDIKDPVKSELAPFRKKATEDYQHLQSFGEFNPYAGSESTRQKGNQRTLPINARNDERYQAETKLHQSAERLNEMQQVAYNVFFKDGGEAEKFLAKAAADNGGKLPEDNHTVALAYQKANNLEKLNQRATAQPDIENLAVELARESDSNLEKQVHALEMHGNANPANMSGELGSKVRELYSSERNKAGYYYNILPQEQTASYVDHLIHEPDMKLIAEKNPAIKKQLEYLLNGGLYERYPDYAKTKILNEVSQEYEHRTNHWVFDPQSPYKSKVLNDIADKLYANQPNLKKVVDENFRDNWGGKIDNPTITSRFGEGFTGAYKGQLSSFKDFIGAGIDPEERIYNQLKKQYGNVSAGETTVKKNIGGAANFLGMLTEMGLAAKLPGKSFSPAATQFGLTAFTFYDGQKDMYTMKYPDNPELANLGAGLTTLAFAFAHKALPSTKLANVVAKNMQPEVANVLSSLENNTISKATKEGFLDKLKQVTVGTIGSAAEGTAQMLAITEGEKAFDQIAGLDERTQKKYEQNPLDVTRNMMIGLAFPSLVMSIGDVNTVSKNLNTLSQFPIRHLEGLDKMLKEGTITQEQYDAKKGDIEHLFNVKQALLADSNVKESNHGRFLLESLSKKYELENKAKIPDASLLRGHDETIKDHQDIQDRILNGEDVIGKEELTKKENAAIDAIKNKNLSGTALEMYGKIISDENASPDQKKMALREISDQLLATGTAEKVGTILGKDASLAIEELGHEGPKETTDLQDIHKEENKVDENIPLKKANEDVAKLETERDAEIEKASKPDLKMEFVSAKELVDSKDPIRNKQIHSDIKDRFKKLREVIDCLWGKK